MTMRPNSDNCVRWRHQKRKDTTAEDAKWSRHANRTTPKNQETKTPKHQNTKRPRHRQTLTRIDQDTKRPRHARQDQNRKRPRHSMTMTPYHPNSSGPTHDKTNGGEGSVKWASSMTTIGLEVEGWKAWGGASHTEREQKKARKKICGCSNKKYVFLTNTYIH